MYHLECCLFKDKISFIALKPEQILRKCLAVAWKAASSFKTRLKALIVKAEKHRKKSPLYDKNYFNCHSRCEK